MTEQSPPQMLRILIGAACAVVVMWGIRQVSHLLTVLLIALLLAFCVLPFARWLIRRFHISKNVAIVTTLALVVVGHLVVSLMLLETSVRIKARVPAYEAQSKLILERAEGFLGAHGVNLSSLSGPAKPSDRAMDLARKWLPDMLGIFSDRLLISLFSFLFLVEMVEHEDAKRTPLARSLAYYGGDVQSFIVVMAKTGAITSAAIFVLLLAVGVDFPLLWASLYFFLHFIPDLGILISFVPPTLLALLTLGWKQALVVAAGILILNSLADYVLKPRFMEKELDISFLQVMLSLVFWGFLLGTWGGILAIPLSMALRRFVMRYSPAMSLAAPA